MTENNEIRVLLQKHSDRKQPRNEQGQFTKRTVWDVVQELGMDTSDLRVRELASRGDVEDPDKAVLRLAVDMFYNKPTDADMPSNIARAAPVSRQEQLMQEYRQGAQGLQGNALIRFKMEMRRKGLNIS